MLNPKHAVLFEPIKIGSVTVKNRYSLGAMTIIGITDEYGCYNQRAVNYYGSIARGGTGLIVTEIAPASVSIDSADTMRRRRSAIINAPRSEVSINNKPNSSPP